MTLSASEIAEVTGGTLVGPGGTTVDGVSSLDAAGPEHLAFVDHAAGLLRALESPSGVIIAGPFAAGASRPAGALVICDQPRLAFARAARRLLPPARRSAGTHPAAVVDPSARLGRDVAIGAHAVIDAGVGIGDRVVVGPGVHINSGVIIGEDTILESNVSIYSGTSIGARVVVHAGTVLGSDGFGYVRDKVTGRYEQFPQVGRLVIEDDVEIGALCAVDRGALGETRIARGTKLDNLVHVAHNVSIGEDVVIAAQVGVAGSAVIEGRVVVAGQVGIADHARIGTGAILGGQCGVPSGEEIDGPGILFWGTPARPMTHYLAERRLLARLAKNRPQP